MTMNQLYVPSAEYCSSPSMSYTHVPDLISSYDDISTDPSPSPPIVSLSTPEAHSPPADLALQMYSSLDSQYHPFPAPSSYPDYLQHPQTSQPAIVNSIEFTDLTKPPPEDPHRRRRRSTTAQDKEAASNMRIRRRAQNRASQRAFRERKEKHVQHLEHELELLETKHQELEKSYTQVEGAHKSLLREVEELKEELGRLRAGSVSREGSVVSGKSSSIPRVGGELKIEDGLFDPFASDGFFGGRSHGEMAF